MTTLTLASLITLSSNAKGYVHSCGFRLHWFAFMKALSPCRLPLPRCSQGEFCFYTENTGSVFVGLLAGTHYLWGRGETLE